MDPFLTHIAQHLNSPRLNKPSGYIGWVKTWPRFADGFLENLPKAAILLHDTRIHEHLAVMGVSERNRRSFRTGTTDPNQLVVLYADDGTPQLLINGGLPGGGGSTTQAAELYALGIEQIVHIGTCALMGDDIPSKQIVLSEGSYKDGAAVQLSGLNEKGLVEPIARPATGLTERLGRALEADGLAVTRSVGYTIPSFYFQPQSLMMDLVDNNNLPGPESVGHVEMEEAGLYATAQRMSKQAASIVVGSDRYRVVDGALVHAFEDDFDQDEAERSMIRAAARAMGVAL